MHRLLTRLHRIFGLSTAVFLFISGLTGAMISWDHELDAWLNPHLYEARSGGAAVTSAETSLALADRAEAANPRMRVQFVPLATEPGHSLMLFMLPRVDPATDELYDVDFNQLAVDPATGLVQGKRMWGEISLARENVLPFLYKLHYTMHLPDAFGLETGMLLMGLVAIVWTLDTLIALWISFPNRKTWRRSFAFRFRQGGARMNFDLHRSGGVWAFPLLLVLAITAVSMNLGDELMRPLVAQFSMLSESPFDSRTPQPPEKPIAPVLTRAQAIERATVQARQRGITAPAGGVFYAADFGVYGVGFYEPDNDHGDGGLGNPWIYLDGRDGAPVGAEIPGEGSAGDIFLQAQFPLHSGRLFGIPGRVAVSLLGLAVAVLSATGVIIWARRRKRRAVAEAEVERSPLGSSLAT